MWTMCESGIVEKSKQMCMDLASSRKEININTMKILSTHSTLGFFFPFFNPCFCFFYFCICIWFFSFFHSYFWVLAYFFLNLFKIYLKIPFFPFLVFFFSFVCVCVSFFNLSLCFMFISGFIFIFIFYPILLVFCVYFVLPALPLFLLSSSTINPKLDN